MIKRGIAWAVRSSGLLFSGTVLTLSTLGMPLAHANGSGFSGSGSGTSGDPFQITSCAQFEDINNNDDGYNGFDKSYKLMQDLNCIPEGNAIIAAGNFSGGSVSKNFRTGFPRPQFPGI